MTNPTNGSRALRIAHLAATGVLAATLINADTPWWAWVVVIAWGLLTGAWGFSDGWDARGDR